MRIYGRYADVHIFNVDHIHIFDYYYILDETEIKIQAKKYVFITT